MNIRNRIATMINNLDMAHGGRSQYSWDTISRAIAGHIINNGLPPEDFVAAAIIAAEIWDGEGDGWMSTHVLEISIEIQNILERVGVKI